MSKPKVTYELHVEQDDTPVHDNVIASGDDEEDDAARLRGLNVNQA